jgi:MoxR-like ATPase
MSNPNALPQCWADLQSALNCGLNKIILFGPPGTGKTYAGLTMGDIAAGSHRLICNEEMTTADVTGNWKPERDTWKWHNGAVINAWEGDGFRGGRVVADEIDKANGDVQSTLLAMFDTQESASWRNPETGRIIRPRDGFSVIMTTNVESMDELPEALKDRFPVAIRINEPHPEALLTLPEDLREVARRSCDADRARRYSLRAFQAFAKLRSGIGQDDAARMIFGANAPGIIDAMRIEALS